MKSTTVVEELLGSEPGFYEARAAIRETADKIRNESEEERVDRDSIRASSGQLLRELDGERRRW